MSLDLDVILKLVQILFFCTAGIVAVLTFVKAKNGLLNTVNTEYHKRVLDRLAGVSEELYEEFDESSTSFWTNDGASKFWKSINAQVKKREDFLVGYEGPLPIGVPDPPGSRRLRRMLDKYKSDPFLPESVRTVVVSFLQSRVDTLFTAYFEAVHHYIELLKKGECWVNLEGNEGWLHNRVNDRLYREGFGISQVEERAHAVRLEIQKYFLKFDPLPKLRP